MDSQWYLYILRCGDGTLYTGITTDVEKRLEAHRSGKGAKYTRGRGPLALRYRETLPDKGAALKREYAIKQLSRREKLALIAPRLTYLPASMRTPSDSAFDDVNHLFSVHP